MLTHRSRWHGITKAKRPKIAARTHMQHSVDGMPHCRHCGQKFQRFEGFRKHLAGACPVLFPPVTLIEGNRTEESATGDGVQVAPHQEVPLGTAPHADSKDSAPVLINDPDFRDNSLIQWKSVLHIARFRKTLGKHCIFCGQWAAASGMKQHIRLAHADTHALHLVAVPLGLAAESPCKYCGAAHSQPRRHLQSCSAVYQASLAELYLRPSAIPTREDPDGGRRSQIGGSRGGAGGFRWTPKLASHGDRAGGGEDNLPEGGRVGWLVQPGQSQVPEEGRGSWKGRVAVLDLEQEEGAHQQDLRDGGSHLAGHGHAEPDPVDDKTGATARERALKPSERDGLHALYRHGAVLVPGDAEAGGGEVAGAVHGQQGDVLPGTDPYVGDGPGPEDQAGGRASGRVPGPALQELRVDQRWRQRLLTDVAFLRVEPGRKEGVPVDNPADPPHKDSGDAGGDGKASSPAGGVAKVPGHEGHHPGSEGRGGSLRDHDRAADGGSPESLRGAPAALGKCGDEAPGSSPSTGAGPTTALGKASGDLVQGHELLRLEPVPELEVADLGRSATVALRGLRNPHNVCYINSCVQAFFWNGALTGEARSVYGALQASICALHAKASLYLPDCMSWRFIFAQWPRLSRQHDAGEFYRHLLQRSMPAAYTGHWESRLSLPFQVSDSGERHYQAALRVPNKGVWEFYICDDNRTPRKAKREDHTIIAANGYLVGLLRVE